MINSLLFFLKLFLTQQKLFLSKVNNIGETIVATEANNDTYCLRKRIEKFPLTESKKLDHGSLTRWQKITQQWPMLIYSLSVTVTKCKQMWRWKWIQDFILLYWNGRYLLFNPGKLESFYRFSFSEVNCL